MDPKSLTPTVLTVTSEILVGFLGGDLLGGRTSAFLCSHHRCLPDLSQQQEGSLSHAGEWGWRSVITKGLLGLALSDPSSSLVPIGSV